MTIGKGQSGNQFMVNFIAEHQDALAGLLHLKNALFTHSLLPPELIARLTLLVSQLWRNGQILYNAVPGEVAQRQHEEQERANVRHAELASFQAAIDHERAAAERSQAAQRAAESRGRLLHQQLVAQRWRSMHARTLLHRERIRFRKEISDMRQHSELLTSMYNNVRQKLEAAASKDSKPKPMKIGIVQSPKRQGRPWRAAPQQKGPLSEIDELGSLAMHLQGFEAEARDEDELQADQATLSSSCQGGSEGCSGRDEESGRETAESGSEGGDALQHSTRHVGSSSDGFHDGRAKSAAPAPRRAPWDPVEPLRNDPPVECLGKSEQGTQAGSVWPSSRSPQSATPLQPPSSMCATGEASALEQSLLHAQQLGYVYEVFEKRMAGLQMQMQVHERAAASSGVAVRGQRKPGRSLATEISWQVLMPVLGECWVGAGWVLGRCWVGAGRLLDTRAGRMLAECLVSAG